MTRPAITGEPLFYNVPTRPVMSSRTAPRMVETLLGRGNGSTTFGYERYYKNAVSSWGDFPTDTASVTWGYNVDGGDWFQCTTTAAGVQRVWAQVGFPAVLGERYLVSFTVDSKTGVTGGYNTTVAGATFTGTASLQNITAGRYVLDLTCTAGGGALVRLGVGVLSNNANDASMRFSNVMVERVSVGTTYPSEYVRPGDRQVFNYTLSGVVTSGSVGTPTTGTPYAIPRRSSVLILGDSFANDPTDYPYWLRYHLRRFPIATNGLGESGATISQITPQIASELARQARTPLAFPYTVCIAHGGVNDVNSNRTLAQMQTDRLAQIAAIEAAGMLPILLTTSPLNNANGSQQTVMDGYNAWLKTLGYPLYDLFTDASDGNNDFKASWNSSDGVHPGSGISEGFSIMGRRLADLLLVLGD